MRSWSQVACALTLALPFVVGLARCKQPGASPPSGPPPTPSATASATSVAAAQSAAPVDAGPYEGPWLAATVLTAPIVSDMEPWTDRKNDRDSKVVRLGYFRLGEKVPVLPGVHKKPNCPEGWYELASGGFVCGKYATIDSEHAKIRTVRPPNLDGSVPYPYGYNVANGTPLYRQPVAYKDRVKLEPWLLRPKKPKIDDDSSAASSSGADGGAGDPAAASSVAADSRDQGASDADVPWWDREPPEGGAVQVTLGDLQESDGPISRRMVRGFILSLDHQFGSGGTLWWKTIAGLSAPSDRVIMTRAATEFHGVWMNQDNGSFATKNVPARRIDKLPIGFILMPNAKRWSLDASHKHASQAEGYLDRFAAFGLTGEQATAGGAQYWETVDGWWMRASDATKTEPNPAPDGLGEHERWIDVNLRRQTLVAFEGATPVFATLVSSGRNEHETPPGSFRVREKHITATMDGDSEIASDGPYSIEDVPYIQYFYGGYALHGAFWHASFGHVKSHGCINLPPWDARALFSWTDPPLPAGWHGTFTNKDNRGTRVMVHEHGPGTCQASGDPTPQCVEHATVAER
jgi:hypothetical protein